MRALKTFLMMLFIVLIPFQDSPLQATPLGFLGASPAFIPLSALMFVSMLQWRMNWRRIRLNRGALLIACYAIIINAAYLLPNELHSHGTSIAAKAFNLSVLTALFLFPIFFVDYDAYPCGGWIKAAFFICAAGMILGDILHVEMIANNPILHCNPNLNLRPRGFCMESSMLSAMLITTGFLSAHFSRSAIEKGFYVLAAGVLVLLAGSKGGMIAYLFIAALIVLLSLRVRRWAMAAFVPIYAVAGCLVYFVAAGRFAEDLASYTSSATRLGLAATSVVAAGHNPLGVGFSGFLPAIDRYAPATSEYISEVSGVSFDLSELLSYVGARTDVNVTTKTLLFDFLAFFGWPFVALYLVFHRWLISGLLRSRRVLLLAAAVYCLVAISTYIEPIGLYNISLVYGLAYHGLHGQESPGSLA